MNPMQCDEMRNVLAAYCLGVLNDNERQSVEAHLKKGCYECLSLLDDMRTIASYLLFSAGERPPTSRVKKKNLSMF
ncbi:MAG: anti-sigma factor family protein [bacterium]